MSTRSWPQKDSEQVWFGVQIIGGLYAIGGLRENRAGLGRLPQHSRAVQFTRIASWDIISRPSGTDRELPDS